jgi:predicted transcriptional regulator
MTKTNEMSPVRKLAEFLKQKKISTMQELKKVVGTDVSMTIYRMLKRLSYRTSYSHNGRYYALNKTLKFNQQGLWTTRSVWFSRHGTLLATLERFVSGSERGFFAQELENLLHVGVKESLLRLVQRGRICRERVSHSYLYCSKNSSVRRQQIADRHAEFAGTGVNVLFKPGEVSDEVKAAIILFTALLDERQRRLFAGIEALQFGRGAERWIAHLLGIHHQTVSKGRRELLEGDVDFKRVRRKGGGRPRIEKKTRNPR